MKTIYAWGLKNSFGKLRIDTRWSVDECCTKLRKGERVVTVRMTEYQTRGEYEGKSNRPKKPRRKTECKSSGATG